MKKLIPIIVCLVLCLLSFFVTSATVSSMKSDLTSQSVKITELKNKLVLQKAENQSKQDEVIEVSTGYDAERRMADDEIASAFLTKCLTWSSYDEYKSVRDSIKSEYKLKESDNFLKVFFPDVKAYVGKGEPDYNYIDANGLNMSYSDMKSYVVDIDDDGTYSYFTFVTVVSQNKTGAEGETQAAFTYKVTKDGKLYDIGANVLS